MRNARLDELQVKTNIGGRNVNNLRNVDDATLMAESKEKLKTLLMREKEESERAGLRLSIKKKKKKNQDHGILLHYFTAKRRGKGKSSDRFLFLGSRLTADADYSHEIRRQLFLGRKAMTN